MSFLQAELQALLRLPSPPDPTVGFFDLGMDSLMAVDLRNRVNRALAGDLVVSNTAVFDYPDTAGLARYLAGELDGAGAGPSPERPPAKVKITSERERVDRLPKEDFLAEAKAALERSDDE